MGVVDTLQSHTFAGILGRVISKFGKLGPDSRTAGEYLSTSRRGPIKVAVALEYLDRMCLLGKKSPLLRPVLVGPQWPYRERRKGQKGTENARMSCCCAVTVSQRSCMRPCMRRGTEFTDRHTKDNRKGKVHSGALSTDYNVNFP